MKKNLFLILVGLTISYFALAQKAGTIDPLFQPNNPANSDEEVIVDNAGFVYGRYGLILRKYLPNGAYDMTFNGGLGYVSLDTKMDNIVKVAVQVDNKIIIVGMKINDIMVYRLNPDGTFDNSFGIIFAHIIISFSSNSYTQVNCIEIQDDGKILIGGRSNEDELMIVRLTSGGTYDGSFGTNGIYRQPLLYTSGVLNLAIQKNNKIIALCSYFFSLPKILQLSPSGVFEVLTNPSPVFMEYTTGLAIQPDGKILYGGQYYINSTPGFGVVRLNQDLSIDTTWGENGIVKYTIIRYGKINILIQPDKKIVIGINKYLSNGVNKVVILRNDSLGNLDASFGTNGVFEDFNTTTFEDNSIAQQKDGKIYYCSIYLVRLHGVTCFESNRGKMITQVGSGNDVAKSIAQRPNGKWVVAGSASPYFGLVGYNADGSLDYNFGSNAIVTTDFQPNTTAYGYSTLVQPDGKILVGGYANGTETYFALARYQTNGVLDNTFGTGGKVTNWINNQNGGIYKIALQTDGKIVAVGWSISNDFTVVRYNSNGTLDNTFGTNGVVTTDILGSSYDSAIDVFIRPDGKIVVAGNAENANGSQFAVARYNSNGSLDTSFDGDGKFTTTVGGIYDYLYGMAVQTDGKIVLVGTASNGSNNNCGIVRVLVNGGLDNLFDGDGKRTFSIGGAGYDDYLTTVTMKADGKILLGGNFVSPTTNSTIFFSLLNSNGSFDTNFDSDGIYTTQIGYKDEEIYSVKYSTDGKIIAAGSYHNGINTDFSFLSISPCAISNEILITNYNSGTNTIEGKYITATNQVNSPANVSYKAANSVFLNSGFTANTGAVFKAEILPSCFY